MKRSYTDSIRIELPELREFYRADPADRKAAPDEIVGRSSVRATPGIRQSAIARKWISWSVDPRVTDRERAIGCVEPLEAIKKHVGRMKAKANAKSR